MLFLNFLGSKTWSDWEKSHLGLSNVIKDNLVSYLKKKFKNQFIIKYSQRDPFEVLEELKCLLDKTKVKIIVLNTRYTVPNEVIKYLTSLQFERNIKLITITSLKV